MVDTPGHADLDVAVPAPEATPEKEEAAAPKKLGRTWLVGLAVVAVLAGAAYTFRDKIASQFASSQPAETAAKDTASPAPAYMPAPAAAPFVEAAKPAVAAAPVKSRTGTSQVVLYPANGMFYLVGPNTFVQCNGRAPVTSLRDPRCKAAALRQG